jgi:hypothetical protein
MHIPELERWDSIKTAVALALYQKIVQEELCAAGGYLLEAVDGLCLAAFTNPAAAAR